MDTVIDHRYSGKNEICIVELTKVTRVGKLTYEGYRVKHIGQFLASSVAETRAEQRM